MKDKTKNEEMDEWENELEMAFCKSLGIQRNELNYIREDYIFGKKVGMPVREALLLYFEIEKITKKKIPEQLIIAGAFETYVHIREMVKNMINN